MAIKEARQSGNNVSVKLEGNSQQFIGTLIGYTSKAVFIKNNRNLNIQVNKTGNTLSPSGVNISLQGNEEIKMYENNVGIKRGSTVYLYDETGHSAGTRCM